MKKFILIPILLVCCCCKPGVYYKERPYKLKKGESVIDSVYGENGAYVIEKKCK